MTDSVDRQFARFCLTGSAKALDRVFVQLSPELLRVATHLAGDPIDGEDLVQRTFLTAIERASSFREEGRVLPWLMGILAMHARSEKRRRGRHVDPMRLELRTVLDPTGAAESVELNEHIDAGLAALPVEQRSVLTLRLRHGLTASEIARALGRPAGTVRSQMARGLERLREALPPGIAAGAWVCLGPSLGMGAFRSRLAAEAGASALPKLVAAKGLCTWAVAPLIQVVAMKYLLAAAVVLLGALASLRFVRAEPQPLEPLSLTVGAANVEPSLDEMVDVASIGGLPTTAEGLARVPARIVAGEPGAIDAPSAYPSEAGVGDIVLRIRDQAGRPVPFAGCYLTPLGKSLDGEEQVIARTGEAGEALVQGLATGEWTAKLLRGASPQGRATVSVGATTTLDLVLPMGVDVEGEVVDGLGEPVAGAEVWLSERWSVDRGLTVGRADDQGQFSLRAVSLDNHVGAYAPGFGVSYLQAPRGALGEVVRMRLVLETVAARLEVQVVDESGRALPNSKVMVERAVAHGSRTLSDGSSASPPPPTRGRTGNDGRVTLASVPLGSVEVHARLAGFGPAIGSMELSAHTENHMRLVLSPEATVHGRVVDASGEPLQAAVVWSGKHGRFDTNRCWTGADGAYELKGLAAGEVTIHCSKQGAITAQSQVSVDTGGEHELDFQLFGASPISGRLVDASGRGAAQYRILARAPGRAPLASTASATDGTFSLALHFEGRCSIEVRPPGDWRGLPLLIERDVEPHSQGLRLVLPDPDTQLAQLRFRPLGPNGKPLGGVRVELWYHESRAWSSFDAAQGAAEVTKDELLTGIASITIHHASHPARSFEDVALEAGETMDLGEVRFERVGRLAGVLVGDLDPERLASLKFMLTSLNRPSGTVTRDGDQNGNQIMSDALRVGEHVLAVSGDFVQTVTIPVVIAHAEVTEVQVRLQRAGLRRIHVRHSAEALPYGWIGATVTDSAGRFIWSGIGKQQGDDSFELRVSAAPGSYTILLDAGGASSRQTEFTIDGWAGSQPALQVVL